MWTTWKNMNVYDDRTIILTEFSTIGMFVTLVPAVAAISCFASKIKNFLKDSITIVMHVFQCCTLKLEQ